MRLAEPSADDAEALGVERALDPEEASKRSANPFYRLEATGGGAGARKPWLERLQEQREGRWHDDYETNRLLRRAHRSQRQEAFVEAAAHQARGVRVPLLPEHPADVLAAQLARTGERHPAVAEVYINLGATEFERGRFADAERWYRKAIDIDSAFYGATHFRTAAHLSMLGRALVSQERYDEARVLFG